MKKNELVTVAQSALTATEVGLGLYHRFRENQTNRRSYVVTLPDSHLIYNDFMHWVNSQVVARRLKVVNESRSKIEFLYDDNSLSTVMLGSHKMLVCVKSLDNDNKSQGELSMFAGQPPNHGVEIRVFSNEAVTALHNFLQKLSDERKRRVEPPSLMRWMRSFWDGNRLPPRELDSVILRAGEKERLLNDFEKFLQAESRYKKIGLPWHRGYLLYGEPGNGKTSLALALAYHYGRDLYSVSLSAVESDNALINMIGDVSPNSIVLIEDIDIFSNSMKRDHGDEKGPTLAGLLNVLDGVHTPHGLVTLVTTNRAETLDAALVRPGRMDYKLELKSPDDDQIARTFQHVYDRPLQVVPRDFNSMADFMAVIKEYQDDPDLAQMEIAVDKSAASVLH